MIRYLLLFILGFHFGINARGQQMQPPGQTVMQETITGFFDALAAMDVAKMKSFCRPDATILENGKVWNLDTLSIRITKRKVNTLDFKRINKLTFVETKVYGDVAWISYFNQATISFNNKTADIKWLESVVLKREEGKWKISLLHSTELEGTP